MMLRRFVWPLIYMAVYAGLVYVVGLLPDPWPSRFTSALPFILILIIYAHFEVKFENFSMDLDAIEEEMDVLRPDVQHRIYRFRFKNDSPNIHIYPENAGSDENERS
jgi:hypothetical protein